MLSTINVSGCWQGIATSGAAVFRYHRCLQQILDQVEGVISLSYPDTSLPGSYRMRGRLQSDALHFQGSSSSRTQVIDGNRTPQPSRAACARASAWDGFYAEAAAGSAGAFAVDGVEVFFEAVGN